MACAVVYAVGQLVAFDPLQRALGLGPLGAIGAAALGVGQLAFYGMDHVPPAPWAYVLFAAGCVVGIVGMTLGDAQAHTWRTLPHRAPSPRCTAESVGAMCGTGDAVVSPAISCAAVSEQQGTALSAGAIAAYAGKMGAPILFGYLYEHIGHGVPFALAAATCACAIGAAVGFTHGPVHLPLGRCTLLSPSHPCTVCGTGAAVGFIALDDRVASTLKRGTAGSDAADAALSEKRHDEASARAKSAADGIEQLQLELKEITRAAHMLHSHTVHVPSPRCTAECMHRVCGTGDIARTQVQGPPALGGTRALRGARRRAARAADGVPHERRDTSWTLSGHFRDSS